MVAWCLLQLVCESSKLKAQSLQHTTVPVPVCSLLQVELAAADTAVVAAPPLLADCKGSQAKQALADENADFWTIKGNSPFVQQCTELVQLAVGKGTQAANKKEGWLKIRNSALNLSQVRKDDGCRLET